MAIVLDTGAVYALADADDAFHAQTVEIIRSTPEALLAPAAILPEVSYLVNKYLGVDVEISILNSIMTGQLVLEELKTADFGRVIELIETYKDAKIGFVDAAIVAIAERLKIAKILTLDRRHFRLIKPRHVQAFDLFP